MSYPPPQPANTVRAGNNGFMNAVSEFLAEHREIAAPIIEWGGFALLVLIILSPFLIIRLQYFRPTQLRHIIGAYLFSFIFCSFLTFNTPLYHWLTYNLFNNYDLLGSFRDAGFMTVLLFAVIYPLMIFYSVKQIFGKFTFKSFILSLVLSIVFFLLLAFLLYNLMLYGLGQASMNF